MEGPNGGRIRSVGAGGPLERMRRWVILGRCERRNRSGVPPRSASVELAGPLPVNASLLGALGFRPGAPFLFVLGVAVSEAGQMIPALPCKKVWAPWRRRLRRAFFA